MIANRWYCLAECATIDSTCGISISFGDSNILFSVLVRYGSSSININSCSLSNNDVKLSVRLRQSGNKWYVDLLSNLEIELSYDLADNIYWSRVDSIAGSGHIIAIIKNIDSRFNTEYGGGGDSLFRRVNIGTEAAPIYALIPRTYENNVVGIISNTFITAGGINEEGDGGDTSYDRLDSWENYIEGTTEGWVLSAKLGYELYQNAGKGLDEAELLKFLTENKYATEGWVRSNFIPLTHPVAAITQEEIDAWNLAASYWDRVNIGTESNPIYTMIPKQLSDYIVGIISDTFITAGGVGSDDGSGYSYNRLDNWINYDETAGDVLSALLGKDLLDRVITLESATGGKLNSVTIKIGTNSYTSVDGVVTLPSFATATELSTLANRVTTNEGNITTLNGRVTSIENILADWFYFDTTNGKLYLKKDTDGNVRHFISYGDIVAGGDAEGGTSSLTVGYQEVITEATGILIGNLLVNGNPIPIYAPLGGGTASNVEWANVLNKPTTLADYGITASDSLLANYVVNSTLANYQPKITEDNKLAYTLISGTPTALKNPNALTFGSKSYDGSSAVTLTASDLGAITSHQTIYSLTIKNSAGTTQLTYTPNSAAGSITLTKAMVGLGNVENTALSTWGGSGNITTLGTISSGVWQGTAIANAYVANLPISKITNLQTTINGINTNISGVSNRVTTLESIIGIDEDGNIYIKKDANGNARVFYNYGDIVAGGYAEGGSSSLTISYIPTITQATGTPIGTLYINDNPNVIYAPISATGIDWSALAAATTEQINISHLTNALSNYVTTSTLSSTLNGYLPLNGGTIGAGNSNSFPLIISSTNAYTGITFATSGGTAYMRYQGGSTWGVTDNGWNNSYTLIHSGNIGSYAPIYNSSGKVLIGATTDNGAKLQVKGAISAIGSIDSVGGYAYYWGTSNQYYLGSNSDDDFYLWSTVSAHLRIGTNSTERMRITRGGNVGIGTNDPQYKLDVNGSFNATSGYINGNTIIHSGNIGSQSINSLYYDDATKGRYYFKPYDYGYLLEGPFSTLRIRGTNIYNSQIEFSDGDNVLRWSLSFRGQNNADNDFYFYRINNDVTTPVLALDYSSGNVGIGTTEPQCELDVNGSIKSNGLLIPNYTAIQSKLADDTTVNVLYITNTDVLRLGHSSYNTLLDGRCVGVGVVNTSYKFNVYGTLNATTIYQNGTTLDNTYLKLSGGTISGTSHQPLVVNSTYTDGGQSFVYVKLHHSSIEKAQIGWNTGSGAFLFNTVAQKGISITNDGNAVFSSNTLIHSGNYSSYALPLSGGTISYSGDWGLKLSTSNGYNNYIWLEGIVNGVTNLLGGYGFNGYNNPVYVSPTGFTYPLIHSENIGSQSVASASSLKPLADNTPADSRGDLDYTYALYTGWWADSSLGYATTYGQFIDLSGVTSWYHRLAFNTSGEIEHFMGINTTTLTKVGSLAYLSSNVASATYATSAGSATSAGIAGMLATEHLIWGQGFDGTGDVSGTLYYVDGIRGYENKINIGLHPSRNVLALGMTLNDSSNNYLGELAYYVDHLILGNFKNGVENCGIAFYDNGFTHLWGGNISIGYNRDGGAKLYVAGNIVATGEITAGSDIRYKSIQNNVHLDTRAIANAPIFDFRWIDREDDKLHLGTSAQYWLDYAPNAVTNGNDFYSLNYGVLGVAIGVSNAKKLLSHEENLLLHSTKLLSHEEKLTLCENRIEQLENENKQLRNELNQLRYGIE